MMMMRRDWIAKHSTVFINCSCILHNEVVIFYQKLFDIDLICEYTITDRVRSKVTTPRNSINEHRLTWGISESLALSHARPCRQLVSRRGFSLNTERLSLPTPAQPSHLILCSLQGEWWRCLGAAAVGRDPPRDGSQRSHQQWAKRAGDTQPNTGADIICYVMSTRHNHN